MFSQIHIWNAPYFKKIIQKNYIYYMTSVVLISRNLNSIHVLILGFSIRNKILNHLNEFIGFLLFPNQHAL